MPKVYIGLGSNLGDREKYIATACNLLEATGALKIKRKSSLLETEPVEYEEQDPFLNMVVCGETSHEPEALLDRLLNIEEGMGRVRDIAKGPRIIDLDILLYDKRILFTDRLILPHPAIKKRWFVLKHLVELDKDLEDPVTKKPYREVQNNERN